MLKRLAIRISEILESAFRSGAGWFLMANGLPSLAAVALGPFILRRVGLEEYPVLGLATYFLSIVSSYSDFSNYTHLLTVYSKRTSNRHADLGNAIALKTVLLILFFSSLWFFVSWHTRKDDLYFLLAIFMLSILLPSANIEWFFIARKRYFQLFLVRGLMTGLQVLLIMTWLFTDKKNAIFIPLITLASGMAGSVFMLWLLGRQQILNWMAAMRLASFRGVHALFLKLLPMSAALLVTPYFLAYALPWYSITSSDKRLFGAFSIAYRLIMGISSLVGPLVIYSISRNATLNRAISFRRTFTWALLAGVCLWMLGMPVLWFYFHMSKVDPNLFSYSFRMFSILMLGIFFLSLRTPYVGRWVIHGRYRYYSLILFISCAPVLALSWVGGKRVSPEWVPWLACLPDFLATCCFIGYNRLCSYYRSFRADIIPLDI